MGSSHRQRHHILSLLTQSVRKSFSRRGFLKGSATAAAALPLLSACGGDSSSRVNNNPTPDQATKPYPGTVEFRHGVASGDPLSDRVIIWTRVTPGDEGPIPVNWEIASDSSFADILNSGAFTTDAERDYTVKVDVDNLQSYRSYYYRFFVNDTYSVIGRMKTAPVADMADRLRFAVVACSNFTFGYFNGYGAIAKRQDLDAVIHLGDYIYETAATSQVEGRDHIPPKEIVTLEDYRLRYAQYRSDPDLQEAHRQHPFINIWDDHETTNNSYKDGADNHDDSEGDWFERKGWAVRAYFEWLPIRDNDDSSFDAPAGSPTPDGLLPEGNGSIQRRLSYGNLLDLIMLDTRLAGRAVQNGTDTVSPEQTILGEAQREWFLGELRNSTAKWKVVGQQMTFAPLKITPFPESSGAAVFLNEDAWDGYRFDRNAVMDEIENNAINDVVFLSGDTHVVTALDVPRDPNSPAYNPLSGEGSLAVEFSSNGIANVGIIGEFFMATNPHLKYSNLLLQGYLLMDFDQERAQGEYYYTGAPTIRSSEELLGAALSSNSGSNSLQLTPIASGEQDGAAELAP
jgi:alkaline phosphatase D